jgi:hypothetical protein
MRAGFDLRRLTTGRRRRTTRAALRLHR